MKKPNTVGGGANTNRNGLEFEQGTDLAEAFIEHPLYKLNGDGIVERTTGREVGRMYGKNKLYKNLLEANGVNYKDIVSKKLLPDDALLVDKTLFVIEKKYQASAGSVDEKLQTCDFKRKQYAKLLAPLGIAVEYYYVLNSAWFDKPSYRDVFDYIESVGCRHFFDIIPLEALGLQ